MSSEQTIEQKVQEAVAHIPAVDAVEASQQPADETQPRTIPEIQQTSIPEQRTLCYMRC